MKDCLLTQYETRCMEESNPLKLKWHSCSWTKSSTTLNDAETYDTCYYCFSYVSSDLGSWTILQSLLPSRSFIRWECDACGNSDGKVDLCGPRSKLSFKLHHAKKKFKHANMVPCHLLSTCRIANRKSCQPSCSFLFLWSWLTLDFVCWTLFHPTWNWCWRLHVGHPDHDSVTDKSSTEVIECALLPSLVIC